MAGKWNHNIHYHPVVLSALGHGRRLVLDVGCGEGTLTRDLRTVAEVAIGVDLDAASLRLASQEARADVHYVRGDLLAPPFAPESFDAVVSVAALHHMDAATGLLAMAGLVRPGGTLVVVGLARSRLPEDLFWEVAALIGSRLLRCRRSYWEHSAPTVWPPPLTYNEAERVASAVLPGARFRRRLLWRYIIVWNKPVPTVDVGA